MRRAAGSRTRAAPAAGTPSRSSAPALPFPAHTLTFPLSCGVRARAQQDIANRKRQNLEINLDDLVEARARRVTRRAGAAE